MTDRDGAPDRRVDDRVTDAPPDDEPSSPGVSRRAVLAGLGGVGVLGTAGGLGTAAMLGDRERFGALFTTGALDLRVDGRSSTARFDLSLDPTTPTGTARTELSLPALARGTNASAYVRLRSSCPVVDAPDPHAVVDAVSLSVDYVDCDTGRVGDPVVAGTLRSLYDDATDPLVAGVPLDGRSRDVAVDDRVAFEPGPPVCLLLTWTLDPAALDERERGVSVAFHFDATQERRFAGFDDTDAVPCDLPVAPDPAAQSAPDDPTAPTPDAT